MDMPTKIEYWTADSVAECLDYHKYLDGDGMDLYRKLWGFLSEAAEAGEATPLGGDGTNGTVETPDGRLSDAKDKPKHWWHRLTEAEQKAISLACRAEDVYYQRYRLKDAAKSRSSEGIIKYARALRESLSADSAFLLHDDKTVLTTLDSIIRGDIERSDVEAVLDGTNSLWNI